MEHIYVQVWMGLPKEIRNKLVIDFKIERTGPAEVRNETVITDGYTNSDLQAFNIESMTNYVGAPDSFIRLWELTLMKAKSELNPPQVMIGVGTIPLNVSDETLEIAPETKFCNLCDSKGVRHKKNCLLAINYKK